MRQADFLAKFDGLEREWSRSYVAGLLPEGWEIVHGPAAVSDFAGGAVLSVACERRGGARAGARLDVNAARIAAAPNAAAILSEVCAELGDQLRQRCEAAR